MKKLIKIRGSFTVPWDKGALIYHKSGMCGFCGNKKYGYTAVRKDVIIAIYHCHIQIISRGKGKSAVAAAAYRSGEKLINEYDGNIHDYTKKGGVIHTEILLPEYAPQKYADRSTLWNAVEEVEKAKNSQLAREIEIALPNELSVEECRELARNFCHKTFTDKGMVADICIHNPSRQQKNIHAHIMLTMRPFNEDGTWGDKQKKEYVLDKDGNKIYDKKKRQYKCKSIPTTDWNSKDKAEEWRYAWADFLNAYLDKNNIAERVDHRSYERQGVEQIPTIHMGVSATQMERKGIDTEKGNINRQIRQDNRLLSFLKKKIAELTAWLKESENTPHEENLVEKILKFWDNGQKFAQAGGYSLSNLKKANKLKDVSSAVAFLQGNNISTMVQLSEKLNATNFSLDSIKSSLQPKQKRIKELSELLDNYEKYKANKEVYQEYASISNPKKKERFYESHRAEITLYQSAERFFDKHLSEKKLKPKSWQSELDELSHSSSIERQKISRLEDDVAVMDTIKRNVESLEKYEEKQRDFSKDKENFLE